MNEFLGKNILCKKVWSMEWAGCFSVGSLEIMAHERHPLSTEVQNPLGGMEFFARRVETYSNYEYVLNAWEESFHF